MSLKGVIMSSTKVNPDEISDLAESILDTCSISKPNPEVAVAALLMAAEFITDTAEISNVVVHRDCSSIQLLVTEKNDNLSETVTTSTVH